MSVKVQQSTHDLNAQEIGNSLYGLQRMNDCDEVRELVAALVPKVRRIKVARHFC